MLTSERTWASAPFEDPEPEPDPDPEPEPPEDEDPPPPPDPPEPLFVVALGFGAAFGLTVRFGLAETEGEADGLGDALAVALPEGEASGDALPARDIVIARPGEVTGGVRLHPARRSAFVPAAHGEGHSDTRGDGDHAQRQCGAELRRPPLGRA